MIVSKYRGLRQCATLKDGLGIARAIRFISNRHAGFTPNCALDFRVES